MVEPRAVTGFGERIASTSGKVVSLTHLWRQRCRCPHLQQHALSPQPQPQPCARDPATAQSLFLIRSKPNTVLYVVSVLYKWHYMKYLIYLYGGACGMCSGTPGKKKHPKIFSSLLLPLSTFWDTTLQASGIQRCPGRASSTCGFKLCSPVLLFTTCLTQIP